MREGGGSGRGTEHGRVQLRERSPPINEDKRASTSLMIANGSSIRSMADELNVGKSTVERWVSEVSHEAISGSSTQGESVTLGMREGGGSRRDTEHGRGSDARGEAPNKRIAGVSKQYMRQLERAFVQRKTSHMLASVRAPPRSLGMTSRSL
jgi:transposase-like protein